MCQSTLVINFQSLPLHTRVCSDQLHHYTAHQSKGSPSTIVLASKCLPFEGTCFVHKCISQSPVPANDGPRMDHIVRLVVASDYCSLIWPQLFCEFPWRLFGAYPSTRIVLCCLRAHYPVTYLSNLCINPEIFIFFLPLYICSYSQVVLAVILRHSNWAMIRWFYFHARFDNFYVYPRFFGESL